MHNRRRWFAFEWTLLLICFAHKSVSRRLNPHKKWKRFSLACKLENIPIHVELVSSYKTGCWELNRDLLRRQVSHLRRIKTIQLTLQEAITTVKKQIKQAQSNKTLPQLLRLHWVNEKLLDPQNLLLHGKRILKELELASFGISPPDQTIDANPIDKDSIFSLRLANIRSLTKEKLQIDKASESLLNSSPDVYVYVESRQKPPDDSLQKCRQVFHSSTEEGRGGTTILVKKNIGVSHSETNIPDTVLLVLHKGKATMILAGTYISQRVNDRAQKLHLVLETLGKLAEKYNDPNVLLFGDLNLNEFTVNRTLQKLSHQLAHLKLRIYNDYTSPTGFPLLMTRKGINKRRVPLYSRLDYIITNGSCTVNTEFVENISDHIFFNVYLDLKQSCVRRVPHIDRNKIYREITSFVNEDITSILAYIKDNLRFFKKVATPTLPTFDPIPFQVVNDQKSLLTNWINDYLSFAKSTTELRFSAFQGLAFKVLRSVTKYDQFQRRDGSIIKAIRDSNDGVTTDPDLVSKALIDHLKRNDDRFLNRAYKDWNSLPSLPKPSKTELERILSRVSQHKALTSFPVPDEFIKYLLNNDLTSVLTNLWDTSTLDQFPEIFYCKLIPLNKVHPQVPAVSQMRPIVATNPLFKVLELRFAEELHQKFWELKGFALSQFGFLKLMSTQAQIFNLLHKVTQGWSRLPGQKLHKHSSLQFHPVIKYNPLHNYIIFIDFKEAYNSINMGLLFDRMKLDRILEEDKLSYLFTIYSRLAIKLDKESFTPKNGVPQGGINSPILFNFAMFYFLTEAAVVINRRIRDSCGLHHLPNPISPDKNFLWADDLASLLQVHPNRAKEWIKIYFEVLIEVGSDWGLTINFNKSAIMDFFTHRTSYNHLSDHDTTWDKKKGTELRLDITINGKPSTIAIPLVTDYKYLGVFISRDLTPQAHISYLKKKINFIANAFKSVGGASESLKFCANTWHVFIRPLLDYSQTYFSFLEDRHKNALHALYRESARKLTFLKSYTPKSLVESLIQYNYKDLDVEYGRVAQDKMLGRANCLNDPALWSKVDYDYRRIDLSSVPLKWVKVWNMLYHPRKNQFNSLPLRKLLSELGTIDVKEFMNKFLVSSVSNVDNIILDKIYNMLISTL